MRLTQRPQTAIAFPETTKMLRDATETSYKITTIVLRSVTRKFQMYYEKTGFAQIWKIP
jgi:hypothetical protein